MKTRIDKEHTALAGSDAGGEHKAGSAVVFTGAVEPTTRPDGSTALDASDEGRLWVDDEYTVHIWDGSAWVDMTPDPIELITDTAIGTIADAATTLQAGWENEAATTVAVHISIFHGSSSPVLDLQYQISDTWVVLYRLKVTLLMISGNAFVLVKPGHKIRLVQTESGNWGVIAAIQTLGL